MNEFLKNNIIWVMGVISVGGGFLLTLYIDVQIAKQLAAKDIVPTYEVANIKDDVKENKDDIDDIEDRWNRLVDALAADGQ